ncbi:hypothetical protein BJ978_003001 [Agromyces terreus]|uniref:TadE family protein n=1 Tax=Agromyces terreus TaxID=424795 RepID=A0A9X2KDI5_9MICO|nr:hypothetical protein [Agromyces terreus]MCP2372325.1 hypothetical protein [Agromyces terreus]
MRRTARDGLRAAADEAGSASLEFLTVGLLLFVPIVYLILSMSAIQAGAFAVEGAARHAARLSAGGASSAGPGSIESAVRIILDDYGVDASSAAVTIDCETATCDQAGERVEVSVRARIPLPLAPEMFGATLTSVPVEATATAQVSRFAVAR